MSNSTSSLFTTPTQFSVQCNNPLIISGKLSFKIRASAASSSPSSTGFDLSNLQTAISKKDSNAVKEALDQLVEIGWSKKWGSQPYVSRRTDWGFFVPYLIGSISLVVLGIGSTSPALLQAAIDGFSSFFPDYQERIARHEAAHFLVSYLIGVPILGYSLDIGKEHVNLIDERLEKLIYSGQLDSKELDRLAVVAMAGLAAEGLKYDKVVGQSADLFTLQRFLNRSKPSLSKDQQQNLTRWAVLFAASLLKNNSKLHESLIAAMTNKASVVECIEAIEKAA